MNGLTERNLDQYACVAYEEVTIDGTVRRPTASLVADSQGALVRFFDGPVRITLDGTTPAAGVGELTGDLAVEEMTRKELDKLRAIREGVTNGTMTLRYYKLVGY